MDPYYYYNYDYILGGRFAALAVGWYIFALAFSVLAIVALWKLFVKAGEEGWAAIIPFYSSYVLYKISWGNGWLFLLLLIPFVNIVIHIITMVKLAKAFGKGGGFACGLIFLYSIFLIIMAFSKDIYYVGPNGIPSGQAPGGYGGQGGNYQEPFRRNDYNQYQQGSGQNPNYHYQRNEPQGGVFCHVCGARIEEGTKFCSGCGRQL